MGTIYCEFDMIQIHPYTLGNGGFCFHIVVVIHVMHSCFIIKLHTNPDFQSYFVSHQLNCLRIINGVFSIVYITIIYISYSYLASLSKELCKVHEPCKWIVQYYVFAICFHQYNIHIYISLSSHYIYLNTTMAYILASA